MWLLSYEWLNFCDTMLFWRSPSLAEETYET
jgi:hypothetical protein